MDGTPPATADDQPQVLDLDKASTQLQQMGKDAAAPAGNSGQAADDRMKSLMDQIKKDGEAGKKP